MNHAPLTLTRQVQQNCHISDALHARDYTLCIYLLKMREYFRWEKGFGYTDSLPERELGDWLVAREALWAEIEEQPLQSIKIEGQAYEPFEAEAINTALAPQGLVYSGGIGSFGKPHFFLGELEQRFDYGGRQVLISGREHARDITAPPAMLQGQTIYIRRESLRRMLWERLEEWQWNKRETAMARAASHYDFAGNFELALDQMTEHEIEPIILHEAGEARAGALLGEGWEEMLHEMGRTRLELVARAVRDHLADCLVTLPTLLEREALASLHFYFANLHGMRQSLFPALQAAYQEWLDGRGLDKMEQVVARGARHWQQSAELLLQRYHQAGAALDGELDTLLPEITL